MIDEIAISVTNLSKIYSLRKKRSQDSWNDANDFRAIDNISFEIRKGESVAIIGANGSGKSTLLKILAGVTKPTKGSVTISGKVASILDVGAGFHPELSGAENIYLNGQILGFNRKEIKQKVSEIIDFSGIEEFINEPVKNYSNGMFLRLAFSIIVHLDFDIYLFDEVMSVGDAEFIVKSKQKIQSLINSEKTVVIVSHNMYDLIAFNTYIQLQQGEIKEISNNSSIISNYLSKAINKNNITVHNKDVVIKDFNEARNHELFHLNEFSLQQPNSTSEFFESNNQLIVNIVFTKLSNKETVDVILTLSDSAGAIILVSSPIVLGMMDETKEAKVVKLECTIPEHFLNSKTYSLGLVFVANASIIKDKSKGKQLINEDVSELFRNYRVIKSIQNLLYFKVNVNMPGFVDVGELDFSTGMLLTALKWKLKS